MSSTDVSVAPEMPVTAPVRIIAGPTGAGKSALAMHLAERSGALIISADSRQVYRGFDIGTAKPSAAERARVRHEGIDVAAPDERWSAAKWAVAAGEWLDDATARGQAVLVVGGTGLWIRALLQPLAEEPPMDASARSALQRELASLDTASLREKVRALDPALAGPRQGRTQLLRAAEVALLTGQRLSDLQAAGSSKPRRRARWLVVDPREDLHRRIEHRLDTMLRAGWADEVRGLLAAVPPDAAAWNACGYREIRAVVDGQATMDEARRLVLVSTRQYAKRQRTWFRHQVDAEESPVVRLDPRVVDAVRQAEEWFDGRDITRVSEE